MVNLWSQPLRAKCKTWKRNGQTHGNWKRFYNKSCMIPVRFAINYQLNRSMCTPAVRTYLLSLFIFVLFVLFFWSNRFRRTRNRNASITSRCPRPCGKPNAASCQTSADSARGEDRRLIIHRLPRGYVRIFCVQFLTPGNLITMSMSVMELPTDYSCHPQDLNSLKTFNQSLIRRALWWCLIGRILMTHDIS